MCGRTASPRAGKCRSTVLMPNITKGVNRHGIREKRAPKTRDAAWNAEQSIESRHRSPFSKLKEPKPFFSLRNHSPCTAQHNAPMIFRSVTLRGLFHYVVLYGKQAVLLVEGPLPCTDRSDATLAYNCTIACEKHTNSIEFDKNARPPRMHAPPHPHAPPHARTSPTPLPPPTRRRNCRWST